MKKLFCLIICLCMLLTFAACTPEEPVTPRRRRENTEETQDNTPSSPILYKVTDGQGNTVYLFGSIHVASDNMYPLPDYVMDAYNASDALAVECDIAGGIGDAVAAMQQMLLTDGSTISDHLPAETYEKAVEILKDNGTYYSALDMYKPVMWYSLISSLAMAEVGVDPDKGIDMHFLELAKDEDKPIHEIESVQQQYDILSGLDMELQAMLLAQTVEYYGTAAYSLSVRALCNAWANGNEEDLINMTATDTTGLDEETAGLFSEYDTVLIGQRNTTMAAYAENALAAGETVFIVVGAAHVVGEGAMADLLAEAGYTVERIGT